MIRHALRSDEVPDPRAAVRAPALSRGAHRTQIRLG
jgi:hypothetical protein